MRTALRTTAVSLALSICAMLLGLTQAHHALPGDTFQVARTASVASAAPGAEAPQGRKLPRTGDTGTDGAHWLVVLPATVDVTPPAARWSAAAGPSHVHSGRCGATPGCRGPPTS
ncbi:hypothetical protein ACQEVZ_14000 [Dactylosporangium sp. CA-152071]|uniref:hypothetical protein n=1 Tax=Dactylosporangium sp. CA-152071 TaxID=3239933 RepID=UPI003D911816